MTASDLIELQFWQGPADGWVYGFNINKVPARIQFICECYQIKEARYAIYQLSIKRKRYEYIGTSRRYQPRVPIRETMVTRPFYTDHKTRTVLQEWVPVSSLKEGNS